jgi:adenosylhomocysteine nucleosidase
MTNANDGTTMADQPNAELDQAHADVGIVAALALEVAPLVERCSKVRKYVGASFTFRGGRYDAAKIAFVESGMGFARARAATQALIDGHTPKWVISAGFSGALLPEMKVGDIAIANALADTHGHELSVDLKMPEDRARGLYVGRLLTADRLVRTVEEKRQLAAQTGAIAVDLESLAVAQVCRDAKTRFLAVRVISDDLSADLPPEVLTVVGSSGYLRMGAALGALWKRPSSFSDLWKLRETAHVAAERLATFLDGVVLQLYQAEH